MLLRGLASEKRRDETRRDSRPTTGVDAEHHLCLATKNKREWNNETDSDSELKWATWEKRKERRHGVCVKL